MGATKNIAIQPKKLLFLTTQEIYTAEHFNAESSGMEQALKQLLVVGRVQDTDTSVGGFVGRGSDVGILQSVT